jgi:hypothetical protein
MRNSLLILLAVAAISLMPIALAQKPETYNPLPRHFPTKQRFVGWSSLRAAAELALCTMAARS